MQVYTIAIRIIEEMCYRLTWTSIPDCYHPRSRIQDHHQWSSSNVYHCEMAQRCRAVILQEIAQHERYISLKKQELNSLLHVNRLPSEVLSEIFVVRVAQWRQLRDPSGRSVANPWVELAHICHRWREIALDSPKFWSNFVVTRLDSTEVMLHRSKHAPLLVEMNTSSWLQPQESIQSTFYHIHRIQSLEFRTYPSHFASYDIGMTAPILHSLLYIVEVRSSHDQLQGTPFDRMDMPSLSILVLGGIRAPWSSPLLRPTLTRLSLKAGLDPRFHHDPATMPEMLQVLNSMPVLEHLELRGVLPAVEADESARKLDTTPLRYLASMIIVASAASAAYFLQCVSYPTTARLHIDCTDHDVRSVNLSLCPVLATKMAAALTEAGAARGTAPSVTVYGSDIGVRLWFDDPGMGVLSAPPALLEPPSALAPLLAVTTSFLFGGAPTHGTLLLSVGYILPEWNVTTLYFEPAEKGIEARYWSAWWEYMVNVRTLVLGRRGYASLSELLDPEYMAHYQASEADDDDAYEDEEPRRLVFFPALKTLTLQGVCMRRSPQVSGSGFGDVVIRVLCDMLDFRKSAGYRVRQLVLVDCVNIRAEDIALLSLSVRNVEWDRKQRWANEADMSR